MCCYIVTNTVIVLHNDEHRYIGELESDVIDHEEKHQAKFRDNIFSTYKALINLKNYKAIRHSRININ